MKKKKYVVTVLVYVLLSVWAVLVIFPFYWMLLTSVKDYGAYSSEYVPQFFTLSPTADNYAEAFSAVPLGQYFLNTLIFTIITTAMMLLVTIPAAFAFFSVLTNPASHFVSECPMPVVMMSSFP